VNIIALEKYFFSQVKPTVSSEQGGRWISIPIHRSADEKIYQVADYELK